MPPRVTFPSQGPLIIDAKGRIIERDWLLALNRLAAQVASGSGVSSVSGSSPIASTGGATPVISLNNTAVTPGTYGDATHVGQFTVDTKGRLTFAANVAISGAGSSWIPLVDGSEPPVFVTDGAGHLMLVAYP